MRCEYAINWRNQKSNKHRVQYKINYLTYIKGNFLLLLLLLLLLHFSCFQRISLGEYYFGLTFISAASDTSSWPDQSSRSPAYHYFRGPIQLIQLNHNWRWWFFQPEISQHGRVSFTHSLLCCYAVLLNVFCKSDNSLLTNLDLMFKFIFYQTYI